MATEPRFYVRATHRGYNIPNPVKSIVGNAHPIRSVIIYDRAYNHRVFAKIDVGDRRNIAGAQAMARAVCAAMNAREEEEGTWTA